MGQITNATAKEHLFGVCTHPDRMASTGALNVLLLVTGLCLVLVPTWVNFHGLEGESAFAVYLAALYPYYAVALGLVLWAIFDYGIKRLVYENFPLTLLASIMAMWVSVAIGTDTLSPMVGLATVLTVATFHVFRRSPIRAGGPDLVTVIPVCYLLVPLVILALPDWIDLPFDLYAFDSFRGFGFSRTDYGYLASVSILMLVNKRTALKWPFIALLLVGLALSENRAALLSLLFAVTLFFWPRIGIPYRVPVWSIFMGGIVAGIILGFDFSGGDRGVGFLQDSGGREEIFSMAWSATFEHPWFGSGGFYQTIMTSDGRSVEAHNALLQSVLNFGIVTTLLWYGLVFRLYCSLRPHGRLFLVNWAIFGIFHPGFDAFLFVPESFFSLLLAVRYGAPDPGEPAFHVSM